MIRAIALMAWCAVACWGQAIAFTHGRWFDGRKFVPRTAYSVHGTLSFHRPARIASTIDLAGGYVVPPFGEAHNHNVEPLNPVGPLVERYLRHGIFYVKNPDCLPDTREKLAGQINTPSAIEVVFSDGGFTTTAGHPIEIHQRNVQRGVWTAAEGDGAFYVVTDDAAQLEQKWPRHLATHPDFIKTYLLFSEDYQARRHDPASFGWTGLDPALLPAIVAKAHAAGLRVSTHIESAADFRNALAAGVDEINHMPGFRMFADVRPHPAEVFALTADDAARAARQGTFIVTTLAGSDRRPEQDALNIHNLRILHAAGARIALGSDSYRVDSLPEALYLDSLHAFDTLTLLKAWCETTAQTIFPHRKIGLLQEGYEASFLVLDGDPLTDFHNVEKIRVRVKQGNVLQLPAEKEKR